VSRHLGIAVTHALKITPISTLSLRCRHCIFLRRVLCTRYSDCSSTISSLSYGDSAQPYLSTADVPNRLASCVALSINRRRSTRISRLTVWQYLPFDYLACFFANARCPSCLHGRWGKSRQVQWVAAGQSHRRMWPLSRFDTGHALFRVLFSIHMGCRTLNRFFWI